MKKRVLALGAAAVLALSLTACGSSQKTETTAAAADTTAVGSEAAADTTAASGEKTVIKLGVVGENNEQWQPVIDKLAEENIDLELVKFADYPLPNRALNDGEIDLNSFQHIAYFEDDCKNNGYDLSIIGETIMAPLGLYSNKIKDVSEIKDGDIIAIPNDATNGGRALKLLESAGLIKVDPAAGYTPTKKDITENPLNLDIKEVEAANTASLLPDVAAAVINGGHAVDNGLNPKEDAIFLESVEEGSDNPYVNIIVARTADKDNELYKKVVDYFRTPEVAKVIEVCTQENVPYYIVGNGSNLLVSDQGYEGVIIQIYKQMNRVEITENEIHAQAGALLSMIANRAMEAELTGFEFAAGIPGTLGGACVMNAGAYGGEMKDVLETVTVLTRDGDVKTLTKDELELGYRISVIAKKDYIVLSAVIRLENGRKEEIKAVMDDLKEKRITKQPLEYPSAGSTFKRPEGYFAGKLIQDAGLRGFQVGGAQVSEKHCGFVVNKDQATAADVMNLMNQVSDKVYEMSGVRLEPEVKRLGVF